MTTEDDFRRAIDADRDDWQTLAVFADWLRDRDDPRADGYAALAALRFRPWALRHSWHWWDVTRGGRSRTNEPTGSQRSHGEMPRDWFEAIADRADGLNDHSFPSPFVAFDVAAVAFARLRAERRTELLAHGAAA